MLALTVASYGADNVQNLKDQVVSDTGDVDQLLRDGVERIAELVQNSWKLENLVDPNSRATVQVHVPFTSLSQWVAVKRHLRQVNLIKSVNLTQLARNGADIELTYLGDEVQFIRALGQADLMITSSGEGLQTMTLAPGGGGRHGRHDAEQFRPHPARRTAMTRPFRFGVALLRFGNDCGPAASVLADRAGRRTDRRLSAACDAAALRGRHGDRVLPRSGLRQAREVDVAHLGNQRGDSDLRPGDRARFPC